MACMSRAGREPGFKKQNQDNCFAFEKYITNEQSLFGAFDGHGPNGMPFRHSHCRACITSLRNKDMGFTSKFPRLPCSSAMLC